MSVPKNRRIPQTREELDLEVARLNRAAAATRNGWHKPCVILDQAALERQPVSVEPVEIIHSRQMASGVRLTAQIVRGGTRYEAARTYPDLEAAQAKLIAGGWAAFEDFKNGGRL